MLERLVKIAGKENVHTDEPMSRHTTFRTGGNAKYFVDAWDEEVLENVLRLCIENALPYYILGNGSNLLVSDSGYDGVMVHFAGDFCGVKVQSGMERSITAGAGAILANVSMAAAKAGLKGMEFAFGIPGSVGGAVVMNAGAYGGEMKQVVKSVRILEIEDIENNKTSQGSTGNMNEIQGIKDTENQKTSAGEIRHFSIREYFCDEMQFGYRDSILKHRQGIVLSVTFELSKGEKEEILAVMDDLTKKRREKQPLEYPSAGSTFKRPEGYFAGKLIEDAGLKGYRVGGAMVSEKHAGFVVNAEGATSSDIIQLIEDVKEKVKAQSGVELEPEVIILD